MTAVSQDVLVLTGVPTCKCSLLGSNRLVSLDPTLELRWSEKQNQD